MRNSRLDPKIASGLHGNSVGQEAGRSFVTGSTILGVLDQYREHFGEPARVIALPMIATPEYLKAVLDNSERTVVYTLRVDRGLSDPEVLASVPGTHWDRERGLDETAYIVPGAGGMGEVLNNSWC